MNSNEETNYVRQYVNSAKADVNITINKHLARCEHRAEMLAVIAGVSFDVVVIFAGILNADGKMKPKAAISLAISSLTQIAEQLPELDMFDDSNGEDSLELDNSEGTN